ncbi:MAG: hypothetical protein ACK4GL_03695 [Flavobacteriales bacterium]
MIKRLFSSFSVCLLFLTSQAQTSNFSISLEEEWWPQAPALHSFAIGEYDQKWFIIGGRTNGLHGFLSPLAFPEDGRKEDITVIDPEKHLSYNIPLGGLDTLLFDALTSSNMLFHQIEDKLIMVGGYGWSRQANDFITFPTLAVLDLACISTSSETIANCINYIEDERMAVCGAHLQMIADTFYLVFGHRFDGIYNRNPNNNFFTQTYTNEVRRFRLNLSDNLPVIFDYQATHDSINFHRRDFNLVPQIFPDGAEGFTAFSGVFQYNSNTPYLNSVDIKSNSQQLNETFNQHLSHYHSAVMPVFDSANNIMHTYFFGGMSQFYMDTLLNVMVEDTLVPFVNTISSISRNAQGQLNEQQLNIVMPGLEGTNAEFIPKRGITARMKKIIELDALQGNTHVGWIYGGIISPETNVSETDPSLSYASNKLYKVYINKDNGEPQKTFGAVNDLMFLRLFPNPGGKLNRTLQFALQRDGEVTISITDKYGRLKKNIKKGFMPAGEHLLELDLGNLSVGTYLIRVETKSGRKALSFIVNE